MMKGIPDRRHRWRSCQLWVLAPRQAASPRVIAAIVALDAALLLAGFFPREAAWLRF